MNDAPSREPVTMVNVWTCVSVSALNRTTAMAAAGDPLSTTQAISQPSPRQSAACAMFRCPRSSGVRLFAPDFISSRAKTKSKMAPNPAPTRFAAETVV